MDHERSAPLLCRIVLAGLMLGVLFFVQAAVGRGAVPRPLLMTLVGMMPAIFVAVFFLKVVLFDFPSLTRKSSASDRSR